MATTTTTVKELLTDEQKKAMGLIQDYSQTGKVGGYQAGQAYTGELGNYDMTELEKTGQSQLAQLVGGGTPEMLDLGKDEIRRLLSSDAYDPYSEKGVYSGMKRNIQREAEEEGDRMKRDLAITGDLYSTTNAKERGLLGERTSNKLSDLLAGLYQDYGNQRLAGASVAGNMGVQEENIDQSRIGMTQEYGQLGRLLQDAQAKEKYTEWARSRGEWLDTLEAAKAVMNKGLETTRTAISDTPTTTSRSSDTYGGKPLSSYLGGSSTRVASGTVSDFKPYVSKASQMQMSTNERFRAGIGNRSFYS